LLDLLGLLITGDISATLSTGLALAVMLLCLMYKWPKIRLVGVGIMVAGIVGVMTLAATQLWLQERADRLIRVLGDYKHSDYGAIAYAARDIALEHSWHGVGLRNFRNLALNVEYNDGIMHANHPHNFYLEWWVETGVPGCLLFIAMVFLLIREAWCGLRLAQGINAVYCAAALGCVAQHYFPLLGMQSYFINWPSVLQWLPIAALFSLVPVSTQSKPSPPVHV